MASTIPVIDGSRSTSLAMIADDLRRFALAAIVDVNASKAGGMRSYEKLADDTAAATATAETALLPLKGTGTITGVKYVGSAALTADNTNFATLIVRRRDATGALVGIVASLATTITAGGALVAFVSKSLGALSFATFADGDVLTFEITKGGTGVIVPRGCLQVAYTAD